MQRSKNGKIFMSRTVYTKHGAAHGEYEITIGDDFVAAKFPATELVKATKYANDLRDATGLPLYVVGDTSNIVDAEPSPLKVCAQ